MILMLSSINIQNKAYEIPTVKSNTIKDTKHNKDTTEIVYNLFLDMGKRLKKDSIITITPCQFAAYATIMCYCESGLKTTSHSKDGSIGIGQLTIQNLIILGTNSNEFEKLTVEEQVQYHERFFRKVNKRTMRNVKYPEDLHAINFAPSRADKKILSKVTNKYLQSLDFDNNNVITKQDLRLFQSHRLKTNATIRNFIKINKI